MRDLNPGRSAGGGGAPSGRAVSRQNTSAKTYITKGPRSARQLAADQRLAAANRRRASKARNFNKAVTGAAVVSGVGGYAAGAAANQRVFSRKVEIHVEGFRSLRRRLYSDKYTNFESLSEGICND